MSFLDLKNVTKIYPNGTKAVHETSLSIDEGEFMVFVGPSGCGKSTLLRMVAGLEDITEGDINLDGKIINEVDHDIIVVIRDQRKKYIRHVYIRNKEKFKFEELPITRLYVQFKSKEFYFEDFERTTINYGDQHIFNFYFDPREKENYFLITEEEFFKP